MIQKTIQGVEVPALGLGTWRLSGRECREGVQDALEIGYRHIDTAQSYENEKEVGQAIAASKIPREEIFLTTKVWMDNLKPARVRRSVEESLKKLATDYVDLLLIHWPGDEVPLEETLDAMLELEEEGKTKHIGVSNFPPSLVERSVRHTPIFCNQVEFHPFLGQDALLEQARRHDHMITAYSPVAKGEVSHDPVLQRIGRTHGKSAIQVTLRWLLQLEKVAAIPKSGSPAHRRHNFEIFDFGLSKAEMGEIGALASGRRLVDPSWGPAWDV